MLERWNRKRIGKLDYAILLSVMIVMYFTLMYTDIVITYTHGINFMSCLFDGNLEDFYAYSIEHAYYSVGAVYYWPIYLLFGIWNLPCWIATNVFQINMFHPLLLLWCKTLVVIFAIGSCYMFDKILKRMEYDEEHRKFALFLLVSSLNFIIPTLTVAQYDIICVFFILWGIKEFIYSEKITWKVLVIFSVAISMKIFAIFIFIPLVLLAEKRILYVLKDIVLGLVMLLVSVVPYMRDESYIELTGWFNQLMTGRMFEAVIDAGNTDIPIFMCLFIGICIYAYCISAKGMHEYYEYIIWLSCAVFATFFIFVQTHPYWIILIAPFMVMLFMMNDKQVKVNVILEFFVNVTLTFVYALLYGNYYNNYNGKYLILNLLGIASAETMDITPGSYLGPDLDKNILVLGAYAAFVACMLAFLVLNHPKKAQQKKNVNIVSQVDHGMLYLREACVVLSLVISMFFALN